MRHSGDPLRSMLRSMRAGLLVMVGLYCTLGIGVAALSGGFPAVGLAALATTVGVLVLTSWWLLPVAATDGRRQWPALTLWQCLVALTVGISAGHPAGLGQRLPSDYVLCAAGAVTAYRATAAGHAGMLALLGGSAVAQARVFGAGHALASILFQLCFYCLMVAVFRIIRISAERTDRTITRLTQAERVAQVTLAVRRDRVDRMRVLHDTVLATLTAVAQGIATGDEPARARFAADLDRLDRPDLLNALAADWRGGVRGDGVAAALDRVAADAGTTGLTVHLRHLGTPAVRLDTAAAEALVGGISEALTNARRHAGVRTVEATVRWDTDRVTARVRDAGPGFDPQRTAHRIGLRESLGLRVTAAGGVVRIESAPGAGTSVEVEVPVHAPSVEPVEVS